MASPIRQFSRKQDQHGKSVGPVSCHVRNKVAAQRRRGSAASPGMEKTLFSIEPPVRALGERKTPGRGPRKVDMTLWGKGAATEWTSFPVTTGKRGIWRLRRRGG